MNHINDIIDALSCCIRIDRDGILNSDCDNCPLHYTDGSVTCEYFEKLSVDVPWQLIVEAITHLQEDKKALYRLMVHNVGNVDVPDGMTREQFNAVADRIVDAIVRSFRGESWPYDN